MIPVPSDERDILALAQDLIEKCRVSVGARSTYYRLMSTIAETGRYDGSKSMLNLMFKHLTDTAAHIFSPVELKFIVDFEHEYPKNIVDRGRVVGNTLTRAWERTSTDMMFGQGVFEALKLGWVGLKQWPEESGPEDARKLTVHQKLVMPWSFGVYREDLCELDAQECLCETVTLTGPEVWQRIYHMPDARKLHAKIMAHARTGEAQANPLSFFHQLLSTSQLNTGLSGALTPQPGGIVSLSGDPNYPIMGPVVAAPTVQMHELWVKDEKDYTTIQVIEDQLLLAPKFKKQNLFIKDSQMHPYSSIQPNQMAGWFWGRSDLVDLIEPQGLLSQWCDDARRLMGLQIDKILAFVGENGITDEKYDDFRRSGYMNLSQGASVEDLTPKFPPELLPMIKWLIETIKILGGFPPIMQGQGDSGVRAGVHANTLLKTGSPSTRDRSLLVERQCAVAADKTLCIKEAKEDKRYWTKAETLKDVEETSFALTDLPDDWRVGVDSHSSSPIFADENQQMIFALRRTGDVTGEYVIDNLPIPNKEAAKIALREREKHKAEEMQMLLQKFPEAAEKVLAKQLGGGGKH